MRNLLATRHFNVFRRLRGRRSHIRHFPASTTKFGTNSKRAVNPFYHAQQSWTDALTTLAVWLPGFRAVLQPQELCFDSVSNIMASGSGGFQSFGIVDYDAAFIGAALYHCSRRPSEVIVIPDCGMVGRLPFRLPVPELIRFILEYEQFSPRMGLLDGTSDIFFGFDTGDMLLVDHDERVWFTPSSTHPKPPPRTAATKQGQ